MDPIDIDELLKSAHEITHGARATEYGPAHLDYERVAEIFGAVSMGVVRDSADAALFMVCVKLARIAHNSHKRRLHVDSVRDAMGYLWVYAKCAQDIEYDIA